MIKEMFDLPSIYGKNRVQFLCGEVIDVLKTLPDKSVHCVVTSPPYFRLRRYTTAVKFKDDVPEETRLKVLKELQELGVEPVEKA